MASPPAWSMGRSKRSTDSFGESKAVPGPGTYTNNFKRQTGPMWKMGSSERSAEARSEVPGPGAYGSPSKIAKTAPKYHFGMRPSISQKELIPGPGAYEPSKNRTADHQAAPCYTMRARSAMPESANCSPGPGAYEPGVGYTKDRPATFRVGTAKRDKFYTTQDVPGPGTYLSNTKGPLDTKEGPRWGFGSSVRDDFGMGNKTAPGPGAYSLGSTLGGRDKGVSISSRKADTTYAEAMKIPGPGAYNVSLNMKPRAPSYGVGNAARSTLAREQLYVPGPGNYTPQLLSARGTVRIGTSKRRPLNEARDTPGPGAYDYKMHTNEGPKYGLVGRKEDVTELCRDKNMPGPGAYTPSVEYVKTSNPKVGLGKSIRAEFGAGNKLPGPGQYDVRGRMAGPKWGFGSDTRVRSLDQRDPAMPGPGTYNLKPKFADVPPYVSSGLKKKVF